MVFPSIGPRVLTRGNQVTQRLSIGETIRLQLGHAFSRVETGYSKRRGEAGICPSIGPRVLTRGNLAKLSRMQTKIITFNWATRSHAWKPRHLFPAAPGDFAFNWATRSHAWKRSAWTGHHQGCKPSIGPRVLTRGNAQKIE